MAGWFLRFMQLCLGSHGYQRKATWVPRFVVMEFHLHVPWPYVMKHAWYVQPLFQHR